MALVLRELARECRRRLVAPGQAVLRDLRVIVPAAISVTAPPSVNSSSLQSRAQPSPWLPRAVSEEEEEQQHGWAAAEMEPALGLEGLGMASPSSASDDDALSSSHRGASLLGGLWDGLVLMAVPKKKVSHRRQRRRLVRYDCENLVGEYTCSACGKPKRRHRLCDDYERCATATAVPRNARKAAAPTGEAAAGADKKGAEA